MTELRSEAQPVDSEEDGSNEAAESVGSETGEGRPATSRRVIHLRRVLGAILVAVGLMGIGAVGTWMLVRDSSRPNASELDQMPDLGGVTLDQAIGVLDTLGIARDSVTVVERESTQHSGFVLDQTPSPGSNLSSNVVLVVTTEVIAMPDVGGLAENDALVVLADAGVGRELITLTKAPAAGPAGVVLAQIPRAGTRNPEDVSLLISEQALSPDVVGLPGLEAVDILEGLGVTVEQETAFDSDAMPGVVLTQSVDPGSALPGEIRLVLNAEPGLLLLTQTTRVDSSSCSERDEAVDGDTYQDSIRCRTRSDRSEAYIEYDLSRDFVVLQMVVGISDLEDESTAIADFTAFADGQNVGTWRASFGEPVLVELDVRDVLRLRLEARAIAPEGSTLDMVFAGPILGGDPAILASYE